MLYFSLVIAYYWFLYSYSVYKAFNFQIHTRNLQQIVFVLAQAFHPPPPPMYSSQEYLYLNIADIFNRLTLNILHRLTASYIPLL